MKAVKIKGLKTERISTDKQEQQAAEAINILCAMLIDALNEGKPFVIAASVLDNNPQNTVVLATRISKQEAHSFLLSVLERSLNDEQFNTIQS